MRASPLDLFGSLPFVEAVDELSLLLVELWLFCGVDVGLVGLLELVGVAVEALAGALVGAVLSVLAPVVLLAARSSSEVSAFGPVSDQSPRSRKRLNEHEDCFSDLSGMMSASREVLIVLRTA